MDVPDPAEQVFIFIAYDGMVSAVKQVPHFVVAAVKILSIRLL